MKIRGRGKKRKNDPEGLPGGQQAAGEDSNGSPPPGIKEQSYTDKEFFDLSSKEEVKEHEPAFVQLSSQKTKREYGRYFKYVPFLAVAGIIVLVVFLLWPSSTITVPELVGKTVDEAMDAARGAGFEPGIAGWEYSDEADNGVVITQQPGAKKKVPKDSLSVELTVSKGPEPELGSEVVPPGTQIDVGHTGVETTGYMVCLDPGHQAEPGGAEWRDPGKVFRITPEGSAVGINTKKPEYEVTLEIALKCKELLEKDGIGVVMTRETSDVSISNVDRAETANNAAADLYLRIHCGSSEDPEMSGTATLFPEKSKYNEATYSYGKAAALFIQAEVCDACDTRDLGVFGKSNNAGLNWSRSPAAEVEIAYLSNPGEDKLLSDDDFQWKAAWGLRNGVKKYLENR